MYVNMRRNYAADPEILFISIVRENFFPMGSLYGVLIFFYVFLDFLQVLQFQPTSQDLQIAWVISMSQFG